MMRWLGHMTVSATRLPGCTEAARERIAGITVIAWLGRSMLLALRGAGAVTRCRLRRSVACKAVGIRRLLLMWLLLRLLSRLRIAVPIRTERGICVAVRLGLLRLAIAGLGI